MAKASPNPLESFATAALLPMSGQFLRIDRALTAGEIKTWLESVLSGSLNGSVSGVTSHLLVGTPTAGTYFKMRGIVTLSYVVFENCVPPPFWDAVVSGIALGETRYCYFLVCEVDIAIGRVIFIQRQGTVNPIPYFEPVMDPKLPSPNLLALTAYQFIHPWLAEATRIERISLRPMSLSVTSLRKKTLEAFDIRTSMSTLGVQRIVPGSMQINGPGTTATQLNLKGRFSLTPKTQRLVQKGGRKTIPELAYWVVCVAHAFIKAKGAKRFPTRLLQALAQPLTTLAGALPDSFLIEYQTLIDRQQAGHLRIIRTIGGKSLPSGDVSHDFNAAIPLTALVLAKGNHSVHTFTGKYPGIEASSGTVELRITVHTLSVGVGLTGTCAYAIQDDIEYPGQTLPLDVYIHKQGLFRVSFDHGRKLYCSEGAYEETDITRSADQLLQIFHPIKLAEKVTSEKGLPTTKSKVFPAASSFRLLVDYFGKSHSMVCDDSTKEWCDFLAVASGARQYAVQWLHAKVKGTTTGNATSAANLQDVVGQAVKNLGRLRLTAKQAKSEKRDAFWGDAYRVPNSKIVTGIPRFIPAGSISVISDFLERLDKCSSNPHSRYIVGIVVPTLSKSHIKAEFSKLGTADAKPESIQMFWLLSSFMHSCLEVNARPVVYCRE